MTETQTHRIAWAIAALLLMAGTAPAAVPLGTDFNYQGQLNTVRRGGYTPGGQAMAGATTHLRATL